MDFKKYAYINDSGINPGDDLPSFISKIDQLSTGITDTFSTNSYGRSRIIPGERKNIHDGIANDFCDFFVTQGYAQETPVCINSDIDDTVCFVGAPTSVLKPYFLQGKIPSKGVVLQQPSLRTHNTKKLKNEEILRRGSTFTGICCLSNYDEGALLLKNTIEFFLNKLEIPLSNIAINIASTDHDLQNLLDKVHNPIQLLFDTKDPKYYTHTYGLGDIVGRNFNFVLKEEKTGNFNDIGNYIIIEDQHRKYGIESGFGTSVIMKELYNLDHVLDTSLISNFLVGKTPYHRKLQDSIVVSLLLHKLGITPNKNSPQSSTFKKYLGGISYNKEKLFLSKDGLKRIIENYESAEYNSTDGTDFLLSQLEDLI